MSTYYVSSLGDDNNSGVSQSTPWRTLSKVNASIKTGDTVQLKCDDTFYGKIKAVSHSTDKTVFSSYGNGEKPLISLYRIINTDAWIKHSENIWKVDLTDTNKYTGYTGDKNTNVGFIKINGIIYPVQRIDIDELIAQWDFYSDLQFLYVFSSENPSSVYQNTIIEVACRTNVVDLSDNMELYNLKIQGSGAHGINGKSVSNNKIYNLEVSEIGGSLLHGFNKGRTRYGNGIQIWQGGSDIEISGCTISDIYDVAFTMQGGDKSKDWVNISFKHNVAKNNNQTLELWARGYVAGFYNCTFENNDCYNAGYGWSADVRPDKNVGVHILFYWFEVTKSDFTITKNIFYRAKNGLYYANKGQDIPEITSQENEIFLDENQSIRSANDNYKVEQFKSFMDQKNKEKDSKIYILGKNKEILKRL